MIVVAIIAILAAIAIPQYQNYVARSQVSRVMGETRTITTAIEDCLIASKPADECFIGWTLSNLVAANQGSSNDVTVGNASTKQKGLKIEGYDNAAKGNVTVEATFGQRAASAINGKTLTWTRTSDGSWACETGVDKKFAASGCPAK